MRGQFMAIHVDPNKSAQRTTIGLVFKQQFPAITQQFSRNNFPDHSWSIPDNS